MPQLSDLMEKKKFVKKSFRPWDLSGTGTIDNQDGVQQSDTPSKETISTKIEPLPTTKVIENEVVTKTIAPIKATVETGNKTCNIKVTTRERTDNKQITEKKQPGNKLVTVREQSSNYLDNITGNTNGIIYLIEAIKKLTGIQKSLFLYVIDVCTARGALDTGHILSLDLAQAANCSVGSAKTSLNRLIEKQVINRLEGKACRGGHLVLGITKEIQAAAIQAQQALFNPLKSAYPDNKTGNNSSNEFSYSSSLLIKKNTTTSLPDDWKVIDFGILSDIGFSETQLMQLYQSGKTSADIVQESINLFAYSLEHNENTKKYPDPLNIFMGVLRKGQRWNEPNYVSPQEIALKQMLDAKKKEKEKREQMIKELVELEFPEWREKLTDSQIKSIVPEATLRTNVSTAINAAIKLYFVEKILLPKIEKLGKE